MNMHEYAVHVTKTPGNIAEGHREHITLMALKYINKD